MCRVGLGITVALVAATFAGAGSASASHLHPCGDQADHLAYNIKANFACGKARGVVRDFRCSGSGECTARAFECRFRSTGHEQGKLKCEHPRDSRVVKWFTAA
jgi:hypothetical protein